MKESQGSQLGPTETEGSQSRFEWSRYFRGILKRLEGKDHYGSGTKRSVLCTFLLTKLYLKVYIGKRHKIKKKKLHLNKVGELVKNRETPVPSQYILKHKEDRGFV